MNILSIDVGIKNLAFCLFYLRSTSCYSIEQWDVINLCEGRKKCEGTNTKKTICQKNASFFKGNNYYCKMHAKKTSLKIPPNDFKEKILKRKKISDLKNLCLSLQIPFNKNIKKTDCLTLLKTHIEKNYYNFIEISKSRDIDLTTLGRTMKKKFDTLFSNINIDCVIIENQISPLANRMKVLQGMITQHFIEAGCKKIIGVSAQNKLKDFLGDKKTTYNERKKLSIQFATDIICKNYAFSKWDTFFLSNKKKDDLADSFLQGIWYLQSNSLIDYNHK